ncbi:MAG TPA: HIT family protein [Pyrinomonadaceae bacterium]|jgi:diadenosine tetraphosphate (Ap4A) HIT family hydrolase
MSGWANPEQWRRLYSGESCPICLVGKPSDVIAELEATFLMAGEDSPMKGYCFLMFKRHAIELYELTSDEASAFMRDVQKVSKAVHKITRAVKLNYEIHGNTLPHLHLHLFPRYVGDIFENQPINPRIVKTPVYAPGEFDDFIARLREAL